MSLGFASLLLTNLIMLIAPQILQRAIDTLRVSSDPGSLPIHAMLFVLVMVVQGVFRYMVRQTIGVVSRRIEYDLRNDLYRCLQSLPLAYYHKNRTGDIMSRLTNDLGSVRNLLGPGIMYSANALILFVAALAVMLSMNVALTLMALIPMIVLPLFSNRMSKRLYDRSRAVQEQIAVLSGMAQETVAGVRVIKAYQREEAAFDRFCAASREYVEKCMGLVRVEGAIWPLMGAIAGLSSVIVVWYGGLRVIDNELTLGELVAFEAYLGYLMWPLMAFGWVINVAQRGKASMTRLTELLDAPGQDGRTEPEDRETVFRGHIEFRNLTFSYNDGVPVLENISFTLEPGKTLAVVGPTGSGKSTLVNLISRLYDPLPKTVFLDGHDVLSLPLRRLREAVGAVPQDTFLFSRTIAGNIAYGVPEATADEIRKAAETARIDHDIAGFPNRYETKIGERGVTLSGGQKQRTAIARAVLSDPVVLILDDCLSNVDTYTEEEILQRMRVFMKDRTTLIVAHRISSIKHADRVLVLEHGRIVEQGDHGTLLANGGLYARMYEKQRLQVSLAETT
ncbi:MAG: ABC transporter ATP-binding protein [candidate division Zixibacteria bacterium]|nr:ABC transporter ATP-binding protein [candidate division Zixibacteria bacterium]